MRQGLMQVSRWACAVAGVCFASAIAACGGSDPATREGPPDPIRCQQIEQDLTAAVSRPGSCNVDDDCELIGGQLGTPSCNNAPYVLDCGGHPIEKNAPGLESARALIEKYKSAGCATEGAWDCAPRGPLLCGPDHRCSAAQRSCYPPPPSDGGTDPTGW